MGFSPSPEKSSTPRADETAKASGPTQVPCGGLPQASLKLITSLLLFHPLVKRTRTPEEQLMTFTSSWASAFTSPSLHGHMLSGGPLGTQFLASENPQSPKGALTQRGMWLREAPANTKETDFQESDSLVLPGKGS